MPSSPTFRIWSGGQKVRHNRALSAELQFSVKNYGRMNIVPGVVPLFVMSWEWIPIIPSPLKPLDDSAVTSSPSTSTSTCTMSPPFTTPLFGPTSENLGGSSSQLSGDSTDFDVLVKYLLGDDDTVPITGDTDLMYVTKKLILSNLLSINLYTGGTLSCILMYSPVMPQTAVQFTRRLRRQGRYKKHRTGAHCNFAALRCETNVS